MLIDGPQTRAFHGWTVFDYLEYRVWGEKAYLVTQNEHAGLALFEMKMDKEGRFVLRIIDGDEPVDMEGFAPFD